MARITGILEAFWETGTEGVHWAILDNDQTGYDALNILKDGDYLFVEDGKGMIEWEGEIKLEYERRYRPYPENPEWGQQEVFGFWVHGFQENVDPEIWATWVFQQRVASAIIKPEEDSKGE